MASRILVVSVALATTLAALCAHAQNPAQDEAAIEQARLHRDAATPQSTTGNDGGEMAVTTNGASSDDDSFGAQKILKNQERPRTVVVSGDASFNYTDNVALTRRGERSDTFEVLDGAITWMPNLQQNLVGSFGIHVASFLYNQTTALDFTNIGAGAGLIWTPNNFGGISIIGRYDFTDLVNRDGDQILRDHAFTLALQKIVPLGRAHALIFGANGLLDIADPSSEQQNQLGLFAGYHLEVARKLEIDVGYHPAGHFYTKAGRNDFNQIVSCGAQYHFNRWAALSASFSYGFNRSDHGAFDYDVLSTGVSLGFTARF